VGFVSYDAALFQALASPASRWPGLEHWLGMEDSNLRYLIQSQASYR
jgi:hypothetical protein